FQKKLAQEQLAQEQRQFEEAQRRAEEAKRRAEEALRKAEAEKLARELAATARQKALAEYVNRIRQRVRSNWILPPDLQGNPEAVFEVIQLPTGDVISVRLKKSSGNVAYDTAVERAILKSSPLPLPTNRNDFSRTLELTFRPSD
ncbi:MAG TPA: TonB family protein, partial [Burkholderiales bacterium]|nr:TonB family protein [Burkholderiales bacterium]